MVRPPPSAPPRFAHFEGVRPALDRWADKLAAEGPRAAITRWLELLCEWNGRIDLTAARSGGELVNLMLEDAYVMSRSLAAGARVLDVGTGAGAPGLALALMRPDLVVTLCEPLAKRAAFLRTVIGSVGRTDITLVAKRGEELKPGEWDEAMARATLPPDAWLALGATLVKPGGHVWVLLATGEPPSRAGATISLDERYTWTETSVARRALSYAIVPTSG